MNQWGPVAVIVAGYVIGLYFQTRQIDSVRSELSAKIDALRNEMIARFEAAHQGLLRVEGVLDARLKHLEDKEK